MTENRRFQLHLENLELGDVSSLLLSSMTGFIVQFGAAGRPSSVALVFGEQKIVFRSHVETIKDWEEVGILDLKIEQLTGSDTTLMLSTREWGRGEAVDLVMFECDEFTVVTGIRVWNLKRESMLITASSLPFSVELKAPFFDGSFDPEFELDELRYERLVV